MLPTDVSRVWPFWLERQSDPASADFVPGAGAAGGTDLPTNITHRRITTLGTLATYERAAVDERGLVAAAGRGWSIDWWVRAEDQWHFPSRSRAVRQRLVGRSPVVETVMRVPGGDVVHRAVAFVDRVRGACVLIEIENRSAVPIAVAAAVRPYDPIGLHPVRSLAVDDDHLRVEGISALVFPRPPAHVVFGSAASGDAAGLLIAGAAPGAGGPIADGAEHVDSDGWSTAAIVFPLAHVATLQLVMPLEQAAAPVRRRGRGPRSTTPVADPSRPEPLGAPTAEQVAKGWDVQLRRGLRIEVPDEQLSTALDVAVAHLLLAHGGEDVVTWDAPSAPLAMAEAAEVLGALDLFGFHDEVEEVLRTWPERQALDGGFEAEAGRLDATPAALAAVAQHWSLTRDADLVDSLIGPLAKAAAWIEKKRSTRRAPRDPNARGLFPNGVAPAGLGGPGTYLRDAALAVTALRAVVPAEIAAGQPEVAADAERYAAALLDDLEATLATLTRLATIGRDHRAESAAEADPPSTASLAAIPATPSRVLDGGVIASLDLAAPFGPLAADDPRISTTLDHIREHLLVGPAVARVIGAAGLDVGATLRLATLELETGDPRALERLMWAVETGGTTVSWPTVVHPRTAGGSAGRPHDPVVTARFVTLVRRLLIRERPGPVPELALLSLWPSSWLGQPVDVRDAPTAFGTCSFSVRWHGERPALLWEIDLHPDIDEVRISAPGLDPSWSSTDARGEALLAVPPVAAPLVPAGDHPGPEATAVTLAPPAPKPEPVTPPAVDGGDSFS